jgi:hypothetical protein
MSEERNMSEERHIVRNWYYQKREIAIIRRREIGIFRRREVGIIGRREIGIRTDSENSKCSKYFQLAFRRK